MVSVCLSAYSATFMHGCPPLAHKIPHSQPPRAGVLNHILCKTQPVLCINRGTRAVHWTSQTILQVKSPQSRAYNEAIPFKVPGPRRDL